MQLNKNATVRILGEKNVSEHGRTRNWFNIQLPPDAKCYIASQYVVDGVVNADSLYVRCGAGKNYRDIGKLSNGDAVEVIAHEGDWSRIRATEGCTGWIAAELVEVAPPAAPEPKPAAAAEPEVVIEATSAFVADPPEAAATERVQVISTDPDVHVAYVWKKGILSRHSTGSSDPAEYQLMRETDMGRRHRVCFVIPPKDLAIKRFEDKMVRIAGNLRWFKGDRYPILEADKIDIVW